MPNKVGCLIISGGPQNYVDIVPLSKASTCTSRAGRIGAERKSKGFVDRVLGHSFWGRGVGGREEQDHTDERNLDLRVKQTKKSQLKRTDLAGV